MSLLNRHQIARIIPHTGAMVLIEEVLQWNEQHLLARTSSHLRDDNPLRDAHGLHIACGIEYAAQAMALHGALRRPGGSGRPRGGLLASARAVELLARRLDEDSTPLLIETELLWGDSAMAMYRFAVRSSTRALLTGRATVLLDALSRRQAPGGVA